MVASSYDNHQQITATQRRHMMGAGPPPPPPGTTLNTITPCAACKLLRRRCAEECPFSPYFSPHEPQKFAAVHKVFGASNVSKLLMEVPENQREDAANSLVYEANVRLRDPVYGCMGAISALQQQVQTLQAELNAVRDQILKHKYREAANTLISTAAHHHHQQHHHHHNHQQHHHPHNNTNSLVTSVAAAVIAASLPQVQSPRHQQPLQQPTPPPPPDTPPPSIAVVSSSPSVGTSLYTPPPPPPQDSGTTAGFSSVSTDHSVPYFD